MSTEPIPQTDRDILRRLAARKVEIAHDPVNLERKAAWYRLDAGDGYRPMVLAEVGGIRDQRRPCGDDLLTCSDPRARNLERGLRAEIWQFDELRDDHVVEPSINTNWQIQVSDFGVKPVMHTTDNDGHLAARNWEPALADLDRDFAKLTPRTFGVNRAATQTSLAWLQELFGSSCPVRLHGGFYWSLGMTWTAIEMVGIEGLMLAMYDNPAGLHRLMAFLRDDLLAFTGWLEREGLYSLNNENDYTGSGSMGYTRRLPQAGWQPGQPVQRADLWCLSESQETVGVGPELFEEFIFPYQQAVASLFGSCYYGCCEPVNNRWHILKRLTNLTRVSVSPWADQAFMAEACGTRTVFSRKPNPTLISTGVFDEAAIRKDLRETLAAARGCRLELIMKDVHTLHEQPARLARWVQLAREEVDRAG